MRLVEGRAVESRTRWSLYKRRCLEPAFKSGSRRFTGDLRSLDLVLRFKPYLHALNDTGGHTS